MIMKKQYQHPEIDVNLFDFEDILTVSGGLGEGDGVVDDLIDDETPVNPWS